MEKEQREDWRRKGGEVLRQEGEKEEAMEEWMEVEEDKRAAGRPLLSVVVVWVDMAGQEEGKRAGKVEGGEKMEGWRQLGRQLECQVLLSEGLCGLCHWKQCWHPSYFHRLSV